MLSFLLFALQADPAFACWACDPGESRESCEQSIIKSQHEQIEKEREHYTEFCKLNPGEEQALGMSTLGSLHTRCDSDGGGCLHWVATLPSTDNKFLKLGGDGYCSQAQIAGFSARASTTASNRPSTDSHGNQISSLGDEGVADGGRSVAVSSTGHALSPQIEITQAAARRRTD